MTPERTIESERATLARYLLGDLPPADNDAVEDRFLAEPALFALYQEVERELMHEYAAGTMSRTETARFERHYLVTGDRRRRLVVLRALLAVESERRARRLGSVPVKKLAPAIAFLGLAIVAATLYWNHRRSSTVSSTRTPPFQQARKTAPRNNSPRRGFEQSAERR
jgi:anti-sigma factor RsiW